MKCTGMTTLNLKTMQQLPYNAFDFAVILTCCLFTATMGECVKEGRLKVTEEWYDRLMSQPFQANSTVHIQFNISYSYSESTTNPLQLVMYSNQVSDRSARREREGVWEREKERGRKRESERAREKEGERARGKRGIGQEKEREGEREGKRKRGRKRGRERAREKECRNEYRYYQLLSHSPTKPTWNGWSWCNNISISQSVTVTTLNCPVKTLEWVNWR